MYKTINEFPKYEINEKGLIRNKDTKVRKYTRVSKCGYEHVQFKSCGKTYSRKVHRLVADLFLPTPDEYIIEWARNNYPYTPCVNHKNADKTDNRVENLEWCTIKENSEHAYDNELVPFLKGQLNGRAKLTDDEVHDICRFYEEGATPKEAVAKFGISRQQATKIRAGFQWKHIWEQYNIVVNRRK